MRPRIRVGEGSRCTSSPEDGRFFASLRMTWFAITLEEVYQSHHCPNLSSRGSRLACRRFIGRQADEGSTAASLDAGACSVIRCCLQAARLRPRCHAEAARVLE